ncbi:MAG: saccharopine dehydrogenase NADP-binding domain-containing protein [Myxococcota bacterium]|nr:saccharopine dehydrogenase NADP-binding domain-containing protein [Myxococcota bacterium]
MPEQEREFEIVVWGASGFTGRLTAEYLLAEHGASGGLRWAIAGRNREKLEALKDELAQETGSSTDALPILIGDSDDEASLVAMAGRSRVICSTVGPYAKYGSGLIKACAESGTAYCDLTGEVHWMQRMIEAHQDAAVASGARIVFNCGFDCIPSDIGAYFMQREMKRLHGEACSQIQLRVKGFSGGASGGTIASMLAMMDEAAVDPGVRRAMSEPYSLNPKDQQTGPDSAEGMAPSYDADFGEWTAPFVMAGINTKVVRRSNALLEYAYGKTFRYDEAVLMGSGVGGFAKAAATSVGSAATLGAMALGPLRRVAAGRLPQPGQGPSKEKREAGYFDLALRGVSDSGRVLHGRVRGDRDPGYGATSKMLGESALCLARDPLAVEGGLWTPASALGEALLARLPQAGVSFELED